MKLAVIIATFGRKEVLSRLLAHLQDQQRLPDEVIVSAPDESHVDPIQATNYPLTFLFGKTGLTHQRNAALEHALQRHDVITFFDDDFVPCTAYLKLLEAAINEHADWALITGRIVRDGAGSSGLTFEQGLEILQAAEANHSAYSKYMACESAYGCNMSVPTRYVENARFDERLVRYGWLEDRDFSAQVGRKGRIVAMQALLGVHLGIKAGRVKGTALGYAQVANPVYLARKGTVSLNVAMRHISRNVVANFAKSLWPEAHIDRRGRLRGNLLAAAHVLTGRVEPEYILRL